MPGTISFTDLDVTDEAVLRCTVTRDDGPAELRFELPHAFTPAPDLIAATFSGMCGEVYDEVRMDVAVGPRMAAAIESATGAHLTHRPGEDVERTPGARRSVDFSGGFDSLAVRALMPGAPLVSLDFGGLFSRERPLFSRFAPSIVTTNLVDLGLNRNLGSFMGTASVLLRDELDLGAHAFGTIQAATLPTLVAGPRAAPPDPVGDVLGLTVVEPVAGVSEPGTMLVVARTTPDLLVDVLESVANRGEMKYHRKRLLLEAVVRRAGLDVELPPLPDTRHRATWGAVPADDLSALYVMTVLGPAALTPMYKDGVPDEVVRWADGRDLTFLERFNPHAYAGLPDDLVAQWCGGLLDQGILPYDRHDWDDAAAAVAAMHSTA